MRMERDADGARAARATALGTRYRNFWRATRKLSREKSRAAGATPRGSGGGTAGVVRGGREEAGGVTRSGSGRGHGRVGSGRVGSGRVCQGSSGRVRRGGAGL